MEDMQRKMAVFFKKSCVGTVGGGGSGGQQGPIKKDDQTAPTPIKEGEGGGWGTKKEERGL